MTIAMCFISPEGVVLGADSAASFHGPEGLHYLNNAQKLFEVGEDGTLGILIWGAGGLPRSSFRTHIAALGDDLKVNPATSVKDAAERWINLLWPVYTAELSATIARGRQLLAMAPFDPVAASPAAGSRSEQEERELFQIANEGTGFCIGGYVLPDRAPAAFLMFFAPLSQKPTLEQVQVGGFWGAPNTIQRLIHGADAGLLEDIMSSGKWTGSQAELAALKQRYALEIPMLPIRDAIDFVHACIYSTIKAHKFSKLSQICGGPIELAVIRTDRKFHWVEHKAWNAAIKEGAHS